MIAREGSSTLDGRCLANVVYKIVPEAAWRAACLTGVYRGSDDDLRDGFIHLSAADQVEGTAARHFLNQSGLLLVAFRSEDLGPALRFEASRNGALFPHLYGELQTGLALCETTMTAGSDGVPRANKDLA